MNELYEDLSKEHVTQGINECKGPEVYSTAFYCLPLTFLVCSVVL